MMNREWLESTWAAPAAGKRPTWADLEWYAIDGHGHLAMFTSAGPGPIPRVVFRDLESHLMLVEYLHNLPLRGRAEVLVRYPCMDDFQGAARRGFFAIDYEGEFASGWYRLVARPETPLVLSELPSWVRQWLEPICLNEVSFASIEGTQVDLSSNKLEWI